MKELKIRYGLGEINTEIYELTRHYLMDQIAGVNKELHRVALQAYNLEKLISVAVESLNQLSTVWRSSDLEHKKECKKCCFQMVFITTEKDMNF